MRSQTDSRVNFPSHWRQISFICFDLGVMNVIGGAGAAHWYSLPLQALGFAQSSFWLGWLFIAIGICAYNVRNLPKLVAILIIIADVLNTVCFLPSWKLGGAVLLVKLSFLMPLFFTLVSMLRMQLKLQKPRDHSYATTLGRGKGAFALLSSMFVSVGAGMIALLLFAAYVMPAIHNSTNPLVNIFHDLFLVPALLLLFPLGATVGELIWMLGSRFYLRRNELAVFIRYLAHMPLMWRLPEKMTKEDPPEPEEFSFDERPIAYQPSRIKRSWPKYVLAAFAILAYVTIGALLVRALIMSRAASTSAAAEVSDVPAGTIVVSKTGQAHFRNINAAVAAAPAGATVLVRAGVYREIVNVDNDITLIGDRGPQRATIECAEIGCLRVTALKANIRNLAIRAKVGFLSRLFDRNHKAVAVVFMNSNAVMEECDITSNRGPGILATGPEAAPELRNIRVHDCSLNGILFTQGSKGVVIDSDIFMNHWAGIRSENGANPIIRRSRLYAGNMDGLLVDLGGAATVEESEFFENKYSGVHVREKSSVSLSRSKSFKNAASGIMINDRGFAKVEASDIFENKDGGIGVVDASDAQIVDTKVHHDRIAAMFVRNNSTAMVEGATIYENPSGLQVESGGKPVVRKSVFRSHVYAAISVENGGELVIEQSQIYGGQNAGIYFHEGGSGRVQDCAVFGNMSSNIAIGSDSNVEIIKSRVSDGAYAGVLALDGGEGSVTDCEIFNNYVGIEMRSSSNLSVQDCTIQNNRQQGVVADGTSSGSITNSKLTGNAAGPWKIEAGAHLQRERNTE